MNFDLFEKCINSHKEFYNKIDILIEALNINHHIEIGDDMSSVLLVTLEDIFNDKSEWISYFIYELNYGDSYEDGMITDVDGTIIKLKTIEDLYNLLMENMNEN